MNSTGLSKGWDCGTGGTCTGTNEGRARALGFPNTHVNAVTWGVQLLPGQSEVSNYPILPAHDLRIGQKTGEIDCVIMGKINFVALLAYPTAYFRRQNRGGLPDTTDSYDISM
jgi:hypothetical protein